jgi:hypothetical protein
MSQLDNANNAAITPTLVNDKAPIDLGCKINNTEFKLSMPDGTALHEAISASLAYLEHFKNMYVSAVEKNKDKILESVPALAHPEVISDKLPATDKATA